MHKIKFRTFQYTWKYYTFKYIDRKLPICTLNQYISLICVFSWFEVRISYLVPWWTKDRWFSRERNSINHTCPTFIPLALPIKANIPINHFLSKNSYVIFPRCSNRSIEINCSSMKLCGSGFLFVSATTGIRINIYMPKNNLRNWVAFPIWVQIGWKLWTY